MKAKAVQSCALIDSSRFRRIPQHGSKQGAITENIFITCIHMNFLISTFPRFSRNIRVTWNIRFILDAARSDEGVDDLIRVGVGCWTTVLQPPLKHYVATHQWMWKYNQNVLTQINDIKVKYINKNIVVFLCNYRPIWPTYPFCSTARGILTLTFRDAAAAENVL